jgi:hypothetical protein
VSAELDAAYRGERERLAAVVQATASRAWVGLYKNRDEATSAVLTVVSAGQARTAALVDAYMATKGETDPKGLDGSRYTTAALRGLPAEEVYDRAFSALGARLALGEELPRALQSGSSAVQRLARTDLQLAQTHAARDWMADDSRVFGYRRVLGPGKNCPLCRAASTRIYYREDLMPIHERCHCSVSPLYGEHPGGLSVPDAAVRVANDPELGPRLLAEDWAA